MSMHGLYPNERTDLLRNGQSLTVTDAAIWPADTVEQRLHIRNHVLLCGVVIPGIHTLEGLAPGGYERIFVLRALGGAAILPGRPRNLRSLDPSAVLPDEITLMLMSRTGIVWTRLEPDEPAIVGTQTGDFKDVLQTSQLISRQHFSAIPDNGGVRITDMSTNGTSVTYAAPL